MKPFVVFIVYDRKLSDAELLRLEHRHRGSGPWRVRLALLGLALRTFFKKVF